MRTAASPTVVWIGRVNGCQCLAQDWRPQKEESTCNHKADQSNFSYVWVWEQEKRKTKTNHLVYGLETPIVQLCSHLQTIKQPAAQPRLGLYCATINHKPSVIDIKTDLSAPWRVCVQIRLLTHLWVNFISPLMQNPIFIWIWNISGYPIDITSIFKDWFLSHLEAHFRPTLCLHTYVSTIQIRKWIAHVRMESYSCVFCHLDSFLQVSETKTANLLHLQDLQPGPFT